jgi:hypothetical protein
VVNVHAEKRRGALSYGINGESSAVGISDFKFEISEKKK